jgi:hypothetical protein
MSCVVRNNFTPLFKKMKDIEIRGPFKSCVKIPRKTKNTTLSEPFTQMQGNINVL